MRRLFISLAILSITTCSSLAQWKSNAGGGLSSQPRSTDRILFDSFFMGALQSKLSGDYNGAFETLKTCRTLDPNNASVLYEMALLLANTGNQAYAADFARQAVELDTTNNFYYVDLAYRESVLADSVENAIPFLDKLISLRPDDKPSYYLQKVTLLRSLKRYDEALATINLIKTEDKSIMIDAELSRASVYEETGKYRKERKIFRSLISQYPSVAKINFEFSRYFYKRQNIDEAIEYCEKASNLPDGNTYRFILSDLYLNQKMDSLYAKTSLKAYADRDIDLQSKLAKLYDVLNRPDKMMYDANWNAYFTQVFTSLQCEYPESPELCALTENFYKNTGKIDKGVETLLRFVSNYPGSEYIWRNILFHFQVNAGVTADSLCYYSKRAVEDLPENPFFHLIYGQALQVADRYSESLVEYEKAYKMYDANRTQEDAQNRMFSLHGMAQCYTNLGRQSSAFGVYELILEENPNDATALNNFAYNLAKSGQELEKAEKMSMRSLKIEPLNATFLDTYAFILFKEERYQEALFVMERCVDQSGSNINSEELDHYGDILKALGKNDEAAKVWKQALEADPDNMTIKKKLDEISAK